MWAFKHRVAAYAQIDDRLTNLYSTRRRRWLLHGGASTGSVEELSCPSATTFLALCGSLSRLPVARGGSHSRLHPACPCVGRVASEVTAVRKAKRLCSRSSTYAVSPGASASSTGVGTICLCLKRIA